METGKRKRNNNRPFIGLTIQKHRTNENRNEFDPAQCGSLEPGQTCILREKDLNETYGSFVYFLYDKDSKTPVQIRKLGTSAPMENGTIRLETFRGIQKEGRVYEALRKLNGFSEMCLPFIHYKEEKGIRYIDFDYTPGETVYEYIHKEKRGIEQRKKVLALCIRTLLFLAEHGYIHGDIKMDNFWWDSEKETVRIFDFELAMREPPIEDRHSTVSLVEEIKRVIALLELQTEFGLSEKVVKELLEEDADRVVESIQESPTKEEGLKRLIEIYKALLSKLELRGGARRRTMRKNRRNK